MFVYGIACYEILRCAQDDSVCYHVGVSCVPQNISEYFTNKPVFPMSVFIIFSHTCKVQNISVLRRFSRLCFVVLVTA